MATIRRVFAMLAYLALSSVGALANAQSLPRAEVDRVLDSVILPAIARDNIAGAAAVVTQHGKVVTVRSYGYANRERRAPVDPTRTLFRVGSLSKIVTATAVMQLVERGTLNLDADVRRYLDFAPPARFAQPITLRMLLAHRAGYSERLKLLYLDDPRKTPSLAAFLRDYPPDQTYPPGTVSSYSNYGSALAGYIVQRASGLSYATYVQRNIFDPLGMMATAQQPPVAHVTDMAASYSREGRRVAFEMIAAAPAGAISATPLSFSKFLSALAGDGSVDGVRILQPKTVATMLRFAYPDRPEALRLREEVGIGFMLDRTTPVSTASHLGSTATFFDMFTIYREPGIVLYYVQNTSANFKLPRELRDAFEARFVPMAQRRPGALVGPDAELLKILPGWYRGSRWSANSILSVSSLLNVRRLTVDDRGAIHWGDKVYRAIGAGIFEAIGDPRKRLLAFDERTGAVRLSDGPGGSWLRLSAQDTPPFNLAIAVLIAVFALLLLLLSATALLRQRRRTPPVESGGAPWLLALIGVLSTTGGIFWFWRDLAAFGNDPFLMTPGFDPMIRAAQIVIGVGLTLLCVALVRFLLMPRSIISIAAAALSASLLVLALWFLLHWHVLSLSLVY